MSVRKTEEVVYSEQEVCSVKPRTQLITIDKSEVLASEWDCGHYMTLSAKFLVMNNWKLSMPLNPRLNLSMIWSLEKMDSQQALKCATLCAQVVMRLAGQPCSAFGSFCALTPVLSAGDTTSSLRPGHARL